MITPTFSLTQNETHVTLVIRAPFAKLSHTEISVGSGACTSDECPVSAPIESSAPSHSSARTAPALLSTPPLSPDATNHLPSSALVSEAPGADLALALAPAPDYVTQSLEDEAACESADRNVLDEHEEARLVVFASKPYFLRLYLPGTRLATTCLELIPLFYSVEPFLV